MDETYIGGKARNMHAADRERRITGRGGVDKTAVIGAKDRTTGHVSAAVIERTDKATLHGFVTDRARARRCTTILPRQEAVRHSSLRRWHIESFWALLKRG